VGGPPGGECQSPGRYVWITKECLSILIPDPEILFTSLDSFELLRILDEVTQNSAYAPEEYLSSLTIYLQRSEASESAPAPTPVEAAKTTKIGLLEAHRKLDQVRLALARNLARALVVGFENPF
jgi:nuclear pore complex protein Nup85